MVFKYRAPLYSELAEVAKIAMGTDEAQKVAQAVFEKAQSIAREEGEEQFADSLQLVAGERPKGRPYIRITADDPEAERKEFGDTNQARLRILGRAAGITIFPDTA